VKPSLYSLFRRSEYQRPASNDEAENEKRWEQCERFAVAAIAYCLENNREFCGYFLMNICGAGEEDLSIRFEIIVEDDLWGDLVLLCDRKVYVVECKIDAALMPHQNPSTDEFWREGGYGKKITDRFANNETTLRYLVLGWDLPLKHRSGPRIQWSQKYWHHLDGFCKSSMIFDLYDTLGNLGVTIFRSRIARNMRKSNNVREACEAFAVLRSAYDTLQLRKDKFEPEIDYSAEGDRWYFGLDICVSRRFQDVESNHGRLQRIVNPPGPAIGWFGYQQNDPESGVCFAVWFYCGKDAKTK
jgi:hypothetical protein